MAPPGDWFNSQPQYGSSQHSVTPVPRNLLPSSGSYGHCTHTYGAQTSGQEKHTYNIHKEEDVLTHLKQLSNKLTRKVKTIKSNICTNPFYLTKSRSTRSLGSKTQQPCILFHSDTCSLLRPIYNWIPWMVLKTREEIVSNRNHYLYSWSFHFLLEKLEGKKWSEF